MKSKIRRRPMKYRADGIPFARFSNAVTGEAAQRCLLVDYGFGGEYTVRERNWATAIGRALNEQWGRLAAKVRGEIDCGDGHIYEVEIVPGNSGKGQEYTDSLVELLGLTPVEEESLAA